MAISIKHPENILKSLKGFYKTYPKSKKTIQDAVKSIGNNPKQGDRYPGFGENHVRKIRIGLKQYRISKKDGLRVVFLYVPQKGKIILLAIYKKNDFGSEKEVKKLIVEQLKGFLKGCALIDFDFL